MRARFKVGLSERVLGGRFCKAFGLSFVLEYNEGLEPPVTCIDDPSVSALTEYKRREDDGTVQGTVGNTSSRDGRIHGTILKSKQPQQSSDGMLERPG